MIKIFADENVEKSVVFSLKEKGFDITSVNIEKRKGLSDKEQLNFAIEKNRVVLTHDLDFVKISKQKDNPGVLFIPKVRKPEEIVKRVVRILELLDLEDLENEVVFV